MLYLEVIYVRFTFQIKITRYWIFINTVYIAVSYDIICTPFATIGGLLIPSFLDGTASNCTMNSETVPCSEMWWFPWIFLGIGLFIIAAGISTAIKIYKSEKSNKNTYYNCYTDRIEKYVGTKLVDTYLMNPNAYIYTFLQTSIQCKKNVGSIGIVITRTNGVCLANIPNYKLAHKQLCDVYHTRHTKMK